MNQQLTPQQFIPITEARSRLADLVEKTKKDKWFFLTKRGRPKVVLVSMALWTKINQEIQKFTQQTFITPKVLPFTRLFSDKEIKKWLKEDKLSLKQRKIISKSEKT